MIRDRLLSFNVKDGQLTKVDRNFVGKNRTINERTEIVAQRRKQEQIVAQLKA